MSETKVVRNTGSSIDVEYGGRSYHFPAASETEVDAGLADVAQYRHGHAGLTIVDFAGEAAHAAAQAAAAAPATEPVAAEEPRSFVCPNGDYASNDGAAYDLHLASAHGLDAQARKDADAKALPEDVKAAGGVEVPAAADVVPAVPAESPSASEPPAVAEIPSTEPVKES